MVRSATVSELLRRQHHVGADLEPLALGIDPGAVVLAQLFQQLVNLGLVNRGVQRLDPDVLVGAGDLLGEPVLQRALRPFVEHPDIGSVVAVLPHAEAESPPPWLRRLGVICVAGGAERSDSVLTASASSWCTTERARW